MLCNCIIIEKVVAVLVCMWFIHQSICESEKTIKYKYYYFFDQKNINIIINNFDP